MKKLVFFDIDGTLVSYNTNPGHIPAPTKEAVRLLKERGHIVAVATGRSLVTASRVMQELEIEDAVLCSGAHIVSDGQTLALHRIERDRATSITRQSLELGCDVFVGTDDLLYTNTHTDESLLDYVRDQSGRTDVIRPIEEMDYACIMNIYGKNLPDPDGIVGVSITYDNGYIELRPSGISKGKGIRALADHYNIPLADVVAVGDSGNDVEMIREAGVGIAVGNGTEQAKAVADIVADRIEDGGIYKAFAQLGLI